MRQTRFFYSNRFLLVFLVALSLEAEPSAFELQSGATKKELKTLKSSSKNLESIITDLQNRILSLEQVQDGIKSLFEGQSLKIKNSLDTLAVHENSIKSLQSLQDVHSQTLKQQSDLLEALKKQVNANQTAIKELDKKVTDMGELLTHINSTMIAQLEAIKKNFGEQDLNPKKQVEQKSSNKPIFQKDISKQKEIFNEASKLLSKKQLEDAKARFQWLVETNYRPANSLYLLGEIAYKQKKYQEAIEFYKKSALLNDKANYMPILLWHTAWAFKYSKDLVNYNKFLDSLIYLYPNSEQGQKAKEIRSKKKDKK